MSIQFAARLTACLALASVFTLLSTAQQAAHPSNADPAAQAQPQAPTKDQAAPAGRQSPSDQDKKEDDKKDTTPVSGPGKVAGTSNDRLFYTLPNFLSIENTQQLPPLSAKQKYAVVARGTFDYVQYPWWAFLSAISQAENSEPGYGQGWGAYGKRFGTAAAEGFFHEFSGWLLFVVAFLMMLGLQRLLLHAIPPPRPGIAMAGAQ